jgi:hypothetical protein
MKFISIVFILLLVSCHKNSGNFIIKGTINDSTLGIGLEGATVSIYQVPAGKETPELIQTITLGSDGAYSFEFKREKMDKYIIKTNKKNYFDLEETIYFSSLTLDEDNLRDYATTAKSWVRLRFFNTNPLTTDQLIFTKQQGKTLCAECCNSGDVYLNGAVDTSIYCINNGNATYSYFYEVLGTSNQGIKSVTTNAFDTTEIYLNY